MAPFSMKPPPGGITPDGVPSVWVSDTTMPSASTQEICVGVWLSEPTRRSSARAPLRLPPRASADPRRAFLGVGVGEQAIQRRRDPLRIADMSLLVEPGDLHRLGADADVVGAVVAERYEIETLEDAQHLRHHDAARRRR